MSEDWRDEAMTKRQIAYLQELGVMADPNWNRGQASDRISEQLAPFIHGSLRSGMMGGDQGVDLA
ncbi:MAG: hypothetical protein KKB37_01580 [Alphaproteobacteria bacterium]|nr:hypothetical protein [Alphaproteobacteria bacterium]